MDQFELRKKKTIERIENNINKLDLIFDHNLKKNKYKCLFDEYSSNDPYKVINYMEKNYLDELINHKSNIWILPNIVSDKIGIKTGTYSDISDIIKEYKSNIPKENVREELTESLNSLDHTSKISPTGDLETDMERNVQELSSLIESEEKTDILSEYEKSEIYKLMDGIEKKTINRVMNKTAINAMMDTNLNLFVCDSSYWSEEDEVVLNQLKNARSPSILLLNKIVLNQ